MKRLGVLFIIMGLFAAGGVAAQALLNTNKYAEMFLDTRKQLNISDYFWDVADDDYYRFCVLGGDIKEIDTPLEISLLSYYSAEVINLRPAAANAILPANNPKQADLKLGAAVFQEIQILRFLGNTAAVSRHEAMLKFITDRKNATRAEIETFYRNNIRGLVSEVVDENIAKSRYGAPTAESLAEIKDMLTQFFLNPTVDNLNVLNRRLRYYSNISGNRGMAAHDILMYSATSFSGALGDAVVSGLPPEKR